MLVLRPQAVAHPRLQTPGPAGALSGRGAGDTLGVQTGHAAGRVETRYPRQPGIHHHAHAVDGQAGLGNIGGQHHLAPAGRRRLDGRALRGEVQLAMQRTEQHIRAPGQTALQLLGHPADLCLAGKKDQQAAGLVAQRLQHRLHHARLDPFTGLPGRAPADIHRVHAPFAGHHRRLAEQRGQPLAFQRGRHQQHLERRVAQQLAAIEGKRQRQIGIQAALVEFVEDHQADTLQRRVVLQTAGKNALGDHLDARTRTDLAVQANAVAHRLADRFAQLAGQALGSGARGQTTRLQHDDALPGQPRLVEQRQRYAGGLAGTGWRLQHRFMACSQGAAQVGQYSVNRQRCHHFSPSGQRL